ncbi:MAG: ABC transporter ATP-binding protein, partial [Gemmatimonas sp.]
TLIAKCERSPERSDVAQNSITLGREIELRDLVFAYEDANAPQLSNVTLTIPAGKTTAIVGASGAGKTTLADILLGLISPGSGAVLIDGVPLDDSSVASWRSQIGYVPQDAFLFNDTVRFNLDWAARDASESEMLAALTSASADEFVSRLPMGLDTVIGERGVRLSGGEKQRLSLARALLRRPGVLILDEATSALDSENEERIFRAILDLHGEMTIVVITHRLSTIRNADLIHVLDNGKLVASGTWDELLAADNSRFRELSRLQGPGAGWSTNAG